MVRVTAAFLVLGCAACQFPGYSTAAPSGGSSAAGAGGAGGIGANGGKQGDGEEGGRSDAGGRNGGGSVSAGASGAPMAGAGGQQAQGGSGSGGSAGVAPQGPGGVWHLTFRDEFEGDQLDGSFWNTTMVDKNVEFRTWGSRQEYIADENVRVEDGACILKAENRASGGQPFTSGTINTGRKFQQYEGFFEARLSMPRGNGLWSVVTLRSLEGWPPAINIVELFGHDAEQASVSYWWKAGNDFVDEGEQHAVSTIDDFHIYGVEWAADDIAFFVDGVEVKRFQGTGGRINGALFPCLNLSIPTPDVGPVPDGTTPWPAEMRVDWVRVYARGEAP